MHLPGLGIDNEEVGQEAKTLWETAPQSMPCVTSELWQQLLDSQSAHAVPDALKNRVKNRLGDLSFDEVLKVPSHARLSVVQLTFDGALRSNNRLPALRSVGFGGSG
jgi:hypothetical protein